MFSVIDSVCVVDGVFCVVVDHTDGNVYRFTVHADSPDGQLMGSVCPEVFNGDLCTNGVFEPGYAEELVAAYYA